MPVPRGAACRAKGPGLVRESGSGEGGPRGHPSAQPVLPPAPGLSLSRAGLCSRGTGRSRASPGLPVPGPGLRHSRVLFTLLSCENPIWVCSLMVRGGVGLLGLTVV